MIFCDNRPGRKYKTGRRYRNNKRYRAGKGKKIARRVRIEDSRKKERIAKYLILTKSRPLWKVNRLK